MPLNEESKTFVVHVTALEVLLRSAEITIHPLQAVRIVSLKQNKAFHQVPPKYKDYTDVFSFNLAMKLSKNTVINKHAIKMEESKQPFYMPI